MTDKPNKSKARKSKPKPVIDVDADEHNANWIRTLDRQPKKQPIALDDTWQNAQWIPALAKAQGVTLDPPPPPQTRQHPPTLPKQPRLTRHR